MPGDQRNGGIAKADGARCLIGAMIRDIGERLFLHIGAVLLLRMRRGNQLQKQKEAEQSFHVLSSPATTGRWQLSSLILAQPQHLIEYFALKRHDLSAQRVWSTKRGIASFTASYQKLIAGKTELECGKMRMLATLI